MWHYNNNNNFYNKIWNRLLACYVFGYKNWTYFQFRGISILCQQNCPSVLYMGNKWLVLFIKQYK